MDLRLTLQLTDLQKVSRTVLVLLFKFKKTKAFIPELACPQDSHIVIIIIIIIIILMQ